MEKRIVYKDDLGNQVIITPANADIPIEEIAAKDVPDGYDYKIVDVADIPRDLVAELESARASAQRQVTGWINGLTGQIQNKYPEVVQKGWDDEVAIAVAYMGGTHNEAQLAILTADATAQDRKPAEHATRILEKAHQFHGIAAQTRTLWLSTKHALENAMSRDQLDAIIAQAKEQALPLAKTYGLV